MKGMTEADVEELRFHRMSKSARWRDFIAKIMKFIVMFAAPVVLSAAMIFVLGVIYVLRPYILAKNFVKTVCQVTGYSVYNKSTSSCNANTDTFNPCLKINVLYGIDYSFGTFHNGILIENEQALVNCHQCSYTFGKYGLFHLYQDTCHSWKDNFNRSLCLEQFISREAIVGTSYDCYYNPNKPDEVVRNLTVIPGSVIHAMFWPVILLILYLLALAFIYYDSKQANLLKKSIRAELKYKENSKRCEKGSTQQQKRQMLSKSLGVRARGFSLSSMSLPPSGMLKSESLPSVFTADLNENFVVENRQIELDDDYYDINSDLRHLDLAVSPRNIDELTTE